MEKSKESGEGLGVKRIKESNWTRFLPSVIGFVIGYLVVHVAVTSGFVDFLLTKLSDAVSFLLLVFGVI